MVPMTRTWKIAAYALIGWGLAYCLVSFLSPLVSTESRVLGAVFFLVSAVLCVVLSVLYVVFSVHEWKNRLVFALLIPCVVLVYMANQRIIEPVDKVRREVARFARESTEAEAFIGSLDREITSRRDWNSWKFSTTEKKAVFNVARSGGKAYGTVPLSDKHQKKLFPAAEDRTVVNVTIIVDSGRFEILFLNLGLLGIAVILGGGLCKLVEKVAYIIPLSIIAGVADFWSVFFGATEEMVRNMETARYFLISFPVIGTPDIMPMIGVTDFVFFGLYIELARKFGLPLKKNIRFLLGIFLAVLILAMVLQHGIPVLPFMAVGFIVINFRDLPFEKEDRKNTVVMIVVLTLVFALISYMKSRQGLG